MSDIDLRTIEIFKEFVFDFGGTYMVIVLLLGHFLIWGIFIKTMIMFTKYIFNGLKKNDC